MIRTGKSELYREISRRAARESPRTTSTCASIRELGLVSAMIVPLRARGRTLGALTLVSSESDRHYDDDDLALAEDLARRAALSIDNAMIFRREHEAAITLQRALLPESLPEVAASSSPRATSPPRRASRSAATGTRSSRCDDGTFGIVIGDIAGRGISAASTMGRVRPRCAAYIADGHPPAEVDAAPRLA